MISIKFNQRAIQCPNAIYLDALLMQEGYEGNTFAVALNRHFIPKLNYSTVQLQENDEIEIIVAMQGG